MPFVRISHTAGKAEGYAPALSQGVHSALVSTFNVPADDLFQVVTEHAVNFGLICTDRYLGIDHTADMVLIQITVSEGRNVDQKKALYRAIVDNLAAAPGVRREDVIINLIETKKENWSFGMGLAQYT